MLYQPRKKMYTTFLYFHRKCCFKADKTTDLGNINSYWFWNDYSKPKGYSVKGKNSISSLACITGSNLISNKFPKFHNVKFQYFYDKISKLTLFGRCFVLSLFCFFFFWLCFVLFFCCFFSCLGGFFLQLLNRRVFFQFKRL